MTAGHEEHTDPLMAVLTDRALSEEQCADPAFLAEHRAAADDVALLREQLGLLADALVEEPPPAPAPVVALRPARRRPLPVALRTVGVAAAGVLVAGFGWLFVQALGHGAADIGASSDKAQSDAKAGGGADEAGSPLADPGYLACARLVAEGDVTAVRPLGDGSGELGVTLRVTRAYTPVGAAARIEVRVGRETDPLIADGEHVLVALPPGSAVPDVWAVGAPEIDRQRSALAGALPAAEGMTCDAGK